MSDLGMQDTCRIVANLAKLSGNFLITSVIESLGEVVTLVGKAGGVVRDRHTRRP